ncbi:MAG: endonuclease/exonuclease/phosphatase family protein [Weeksellaceae bacterium]
MALLFLVLSIPLITLIKPWFPLWNSNTETKGELSLMTYNVRYFYDDFNGIQDLIVSKRPDVFFFQEMGANPEKIIEALGSEEPYFFENYNSLGIASVYPIIETNQIRHENYPLCAVYSDIAMPQDTIRLINVYLESLHLNQEEIKQTSANTADVSYKSKMLISKVATASQVHQQQIKLIKKVIKNSPHPVILGGDFNAVPTSFEYYKLRENLIDGFTVSGYQIGHTFRTLGVPLKLDYIFTSKDLKTTRYEILKVNYSDHYPTWAEFSFID